MNNNIAKEFGFWCAEQNNIKKARKIKKVFDKMVELSLNNSVLDGDYDVYILFMGAYQTNFDKAYRGV